MTSARFAVADFQRLVTRLFRATVQLEKDLVIAADVAVYGITRGESPVVSISDAVTRCASGPWSAVPCPNGALSPSQRRFCRVASQVW